jgi:hypothetical protein
MSSRLVAVAALATICLASLGCRSMGCGDDCGRSCGRGSSYAFAKYDCACDKTCGGCCGACGGEKCNCSTPCGCDSARGSCGGACSGGLMSRLCGCTGCGELYWSDWHNFPPARCEPCDCLGNYVGPGSPGYYRAPYRRHDGFAADKHDASVEALELAGTTEEANVDSAEEPLAE